MGGSFSSRRPRANKNTCSASRFRVHPDLMAKVFEAHRGGDGSPELGMCARICRPKCMTYIEQPTTTDRTSDLFDLVLTLLLTFPFGGALGAQVHNAEEDETNARADSSDIIWPGCRKESWIAIVSWRNHCNWHRDLKRSESGRGHDVIKL